MPSDKEQIQARMMRLQLQQKLKSDQQQLRRLYGELEQSLRDEQFVRSKELFSRAHQLEQECIELAATLQVPAGAESPHQLLLGVIDVLRERLAGDETLAPGEVEARFEWLAGLEADLVGAGTEAERSATVALREVLVDRAAQALRSGKTDTAQVFAEAAFTRAPAHSPARLCLIQVLIACSAAAGTGSAPTLRASHLSRARELIAPLLTDDSAATLLRELESEEGAAYYALGEEARSAGQMDRARHYWRRVPPGSPQGAHAADRLRQDRARRVTLWSSLALGAGLILLLLVLLGRTFISWPASVCALPGVGAILCASTTAPPSTAWATDAIALLAAAYATLR